MILGNRALRIDGENGPILLWRSPEGVVHISADSDPDLMRGLGYAHAHDRLAQMVLVRLVGQGRLAECLRADRETVATDTTMRRLGMARDARADVDNLTSGARAPCEAYAGGVNHYLERNRTPPIELLLTRHRAEPWRVEDTLLMVKLMSYVNLAQAQQGVEKWIIQAVLAGADLNRLRDLFRPELDKFDPATLDGLRLEEPFVPAALRWLPSLPRTAASNNWVVSARRTVTGSAILCNDPHLEVNRLPSVFAEVVLDGPNDYWMGATMPGISGVLMGRTRHVSVGLTYGFADLIDYFVEDCRDGGFRRGDDRVSFDRRTEVILRKDMAPLHLDVYENLHGVLEGDPNLPGRYLCRAWSMHKNGAAPTINAWARLRDAGCAKEAMAALSGIGISGNWLVADSAGNIGYQMSGAVPLRHPGHSGLFPAPGWDESFDWRGLAAPETLSSLYNPPEGFIATANDDWNQPDRTRAINLHMSSYRVDRIRDLLAANSRVTTADMKRMHGDLLSLQAKRFMEVLRPLVPDSEHGRRMAKWDATYSAISREATWFERIYSELKREVFGRRFLGEEVWQYLEEETALLADFHGHFDRVLLEDDPSLWLGDEERDDVYRQVIARVLTETPQPWGERNRIEMHHILFGGKLPAWLGFDRGPITLPGSRATIPQAAIYRSGGRATSFHPSFRMIADMGEDTLLTNMAGGPSGDRLSPWYASDLPRWLAGEYKNLRPQPPPRGRPLHTGRPGPGHAVGLVRDLLPMLARRASSRP